MSDTGSSNTMNYSSSTILIIEDDRDLLYANKIMLEEKGYHVITAENLTGARNQMYENIPDLILLDVMLPDGSGLDFLVELRAAHTVSRSLPVLVLTALDSDDDVVAGLDMGADDYLTKPYAKSVLLARIATLLRRAHIDEVIEYGPITLDMNTLSARLSGEDMMLTQRDFAMLYYFIKHDNRNIPPDQLYLQVWNQPMSLDSSAVKTAVSRLRTKLADSGYTISAERGMGYRFEPV